jgi:predicted 3-demethylubiquinone-9 3-methyltransferase (glyoxalase superfamily)
LWFDGQAKEAAEFYVSVFPDSRISQLSYFGGEGQDVHGRPEGSVMTVDFELRGQPFVALNGGPAFRFSEAVSFQVICENQRELDYYWETLSRGGDEEAQQCGWLKDCFGLSWQGLPEILPAMLQDPDREKADNVMQAMLQMKKLDFQALKSAYG